MEEPIEFAAFGRDYIANLLESRAKTKPEPSPLHLTRNADLLELELPEPDLEDYDQASGTDANDNNQGETS